MRVESPFFDKSLVRFILTRARGLDILTFNKIRKTEFSTQNQQIKTKTPKKPSFCQKFILLKNIYKKFYYGSVYSEN